MHLPDITMLTRLTESSIGGFRGGRAIAKNTTNIIIIV